MIKMKKSIWKEAFKLTLKDIPLIIGFIVIISLLK